MTKHDFSRHRVLVVGDAMLDRYLEGATRRISPEAPVPIVRVEETFERPGGAANVALNLATLGVPVTLMTWTGDDADADALQRRLEEAKVACRFLRSARERTIVKLRVLSSHQQVIRLDFEDDFGREDASRLVAAFEEEIARHDLVVLSDYAKGVLKPVAQLIALCRARGVPALVDPKGSDFERYRGAHIITPNTSEFTTVAGIARDDADFDARAAALRDRIGVDNLLVTRGERGMSLYRGAHRPAHFPAHALDVYDVTGAGDTAIATLAAAVAAGLAIEDAVRLANRAAGIVVGRKGTATVTLQELMSPDDPSYALADEAGVLALIAQARRRGERIVMTNGCFDILHAGHVDYLTRAKSLGDRLVVAVNSDASVARLKGPSRPVNTLEHRMAMLAALKPVDWVVAFDGSVGLDGSHADTPLDLIVKIRPDVLVKGGDYRIDDIVGAKEVIGWGGEVRTLPFVDGLSTTAIIARASGGGA